MWAYQKIYIYIFLNACKMHFENLLPVSSPEKRGGLGMGPATPPRKNSLATETETREKTAPGGRREKRFRWLKNPDFWTVCLLVDFQPTTVDGISIRMLCFRKTTNLLLYSTSPGIPYYIQRVHPRDSWLFLLKLRRCDPIILLQMFGSIPKNLGLAELNARLTVDTNCHLLCERPMTKHATSVG